MTASYSKINNDNEKMTASDSTINDDNKKITASDSTINNDNKKWQYTLVKQQPRNIVRVYINA